MLKSRIARDERPLGQLIWWLMFVGWTPILASYGYVLDPVTTFEAGAINTFTRDVTLFQQRGFSHPALGILTLATLLQTLAIWRLGWHALWPIPMFLFVSCFIYVFNAPDTGSATEYTVHAIYAVFATWSAYLFLRHGHLMSPGFGGYVVLLLGDVALHRLGLEGGLLGQVFDGYQPSLLGIGLFLALTVLVRMVWLMVRDNRAFVKTIDRPTRRKALARTLRLWWPMSLVFVTFTLGWWAVGHYWVKPTALEQLTSETQQARQTMTDAIAAQKAGLRRRYGGRAMRRFGTPQFLRAFAETRKNLLAETQHFLQDWQSEPETGENTLERALRRLVEIRTAALSAQIQLAIVDAGHQSLGLRDAPRKARGKLETEIFPENVLPTMQVPECFPVTFLDPACAVEASMAKAANKALYSLREGVIDGLVGAIKGPAREAAQSAEHATHDALAKTRTQFEQLAADTTAVIKHGFQIWRNVSLLALLYSLIVLLKTFLIVFSRVIFSPKLAPGVAAPFLPEDVTVAPPQLTRHAQLLCIPVDDPEAHFVSRWGVTLEGPPPARRRPLGLRFPFIRLFTRTWSMNRIDGARDPDDHEYDAHLKVDEPAELVSWRLREGEQAVFRFQDFVGMSETLTVQRVASLSITTLILGRMIYYVAEGPGLLILRTTAAARVSSDPESQRPAPMPKLVAWAAHTHFGILAALTTVDTFLSGYNLKTDASDTVIWDTSTRRGNGPGSGIARFVKSFLLPI